MRKIGRIFFLLLALLLIIAVFMPGHYSRAILYGNANIDDYTLFQNRVVRNDQPVPWQKDSLYNIQKISPEYQQVFDSYGTTAFVVIRDNKLVHEEYWNGASDTTRSNSFSAAKSIVSLLIGCLIDEGKISSVEQPVKDFLPGLKTNGFALRIKDLLTMSSGLNWDESYSSLFSPTTEAYYGDNLKEQMLELEIVNKPGNKFEYQSCDTQLLGMIVEAASGKSISEYASEKLWKPLGAEHPALWSLDREGGIEKAYCCFNSTATDFARIGQMVLDSGKFNQVQLVSAAYIRDATSPADFLVGEDNSPCYYYGYHFWILNHKGHKVVYARGILGQYIFIIPDLDAVVVRLGTSRSKEYLKHAPKDVYTYLDAAFELLRNQ